MLSFSRSSYRRKNFRLQYAPIKITRNIGGALWELHNSMMPRERVRRPDHFSPTLATNTQSRLSYSIFEIPNQIRNLTFSFL